jgi:DNA-binding transcriptional MerR regulator
MEVGSRIPEKLYFRIGEVCDLIKVQPHVLRYWETEFPMLAPQKNRSGQRVYRRKDVEMVFRIRDLLYEEKFTIAGAKKKLLEETRPGATKPKATRGETPAKTTPPSAAAEPSSMPEHPVAEPPSAEDVGSTALLPGLQPHPQKGSASTRNQPSDSLPAQTKRVLRLLKTDLEDLLTRLNTDVTFKR